MYLAGVSTRWVADITEALWDTRVSSATVSKLNQSVYEHIEKWRNRSIEGEFPYVYLDGVSLKRRGGGERVCIDSHRGGDRRSSSRSGGGGRG